MLAVSSRGCVSRDTERSQNRQAEGIRDEQSADGVGETDDFESRVAEREDAKRRENPSWVVV